MIATAKAYPENSSAQGRTSDDDLHGIGGGAVDGDHFLHCLNSLEHIDRVLRSEVQQLLSLPWPSVWGRCGTAFRRKTTKL